MKLQIFLLLTFILGCGASSSKNESTIKKKDSPSEAKNTETETATKQESKTVIVENKQIIVTLKAKLRAKYEQAQLPAKLVDLLVDSRIDFDVPPGFKGQLPQINNYWEYDYAIASESKKVEIRFKIFPLEDEPPSTKQIPNMTISNELINTMIRLNGANLIADLQRHPKTVAQSRFNAEKYISATFSPDKNITSFELGSAGIVTKKDYGRVIIVTFMDSIEDEQTRNEWMVGVGALRFATEAEE